jgi:hypothetical protein
MVELLYGDPIDFVKLATKTRLDIWLLKNLLTAHASKNELRGTRSAGKVLAFSKGDMQISVANGEEIMPWRSRPPCRPNYADEANADRVMCAP